MPNSLQTSSIICVDANLVVIRVADPNDAVVQGTWRQWRLDGRGFVAPNLIWYEVTNVLRQLMRSGQMSAAAASAALDAALTIPIAVHLGADLHRGALDLAQRLNLPATYDAHYLVLAERLGVDFWTLDQRLFNSIGARLPWVKLVQGETTT
jgi:predicted nucleic acid-binding protein